VIPVRHSQNIGRQALYTGNSVSEISFASGVKTEVDEVLLRRGTLHWVLRSAAIVRKLFAKSVAALLPES